LLFCLANHVGRVYTFNATLMFLLVAADLVFALLTGRLRLAARYRDGEVRAVDVPTGRGIGACLATSVLALLIVGASPFSLGHAIRAPVAWYAFHYGDVGAAVTDLWVILALVAVSFAIGRAVKRRQWQRASSALLGFLALSVLATTVVGAWLLAREHAWWPYLWAVTGLVVAAALGMVAVKVGEAADRHDSARARARPKGTPSKAFTPKATGGPPLHPGGGRGGRGRKSEVQSRRRG
jgi:Na+/melibiose symporter-like transporter